MICRKNVISLDSEEISFTISFTAVDTWAMLHHLVRLRHKDKPENLDWALNSPVSKSDLIFYLTHDASHALGWLPERRSMPIAEWVISNGVKHKYLKQERDEDGRAYYTFSAMMGNRNGRPPKDS
jgi:hypothetical protein